jgi:hypothetical protein
MVLREGTAKNKKYKAVFYKDDMKYRTVHFGDITVDDYLSSKNEVNKARYLKRYQKKEHKDPINKGTLIRYILWNKQDLNESVDDYKKLFNLDVSIEI